MVTTTVESKIRDLLTMTPKRSIVDTSLKLAGVMVLVYSKEGVYHMMFNRRSHQVTKHKGEIAFPGGGHEEGDSDLLETALRETYEEMGIRSKDITVLGELDDFKTITDYKVSPYVGSFVWPYNFNPNKEVAEVKEIPLGALFDTNNHRSDMRLAGNEIQSMPVYVYEGTVIYGATAMILERFLSILETAGDRAPWRN